VYVDKHGRKHHGAQLIRCCAHDLNRGCRLDCSSPDVTFVYAS
jgi:hypothetical protein